MDSIPPIPPDFKDVERIIAASLAEDIGAGDATAEALVPENVTGRFRFVPREPLVACGADVVARVFAALDVRIQTTLLCVDGESCPAKHALIDVTGPARSMLTAERTALNLLQRMCAVATLTRRYVDAIRGTRARIYDTRKTMPGLRVLDKYAVRAGGGHNQRMRLDDAILIKDNHIVLAGSVEAALARASAHNPRGLPVQIECDTVSQMDAALAAGATSILLDNMDVPTLCEAVARNAGRAILEASGNMRLETVRAVAETGVDRISVGRLTHSVPAVDIGLDVALDR